ncbi:MAG: hypothetical protein K2X03_22115 [Bryobacteraceae bacterium]|nr:hypothetical protein [Bryobacteraceae bacterium]
MWLPAQEPTFTSSTSFTQSTQATAVDRQVSLFRTRLVARSAGGTVLAEVNLELPPEAAEVQSVLWKMAAELRAKPETAVVQGPSRLTQANTSEAQVSRERTRSTRTIGVSRRETLGPGVILTGALASPDYPCAGYTGGAPAGMGGLAPDDGFPFHFTTPVEPFRCPGGTRVDVPSGGRNWDTLTHIHTSVDETVTTTRTTTISSVIELTGSQAQSGVVPLSPVGVLGEDREDQGIQVRYVSNLDLREAEIWVTNSGARGAGLAAGFTAATTGAFCLNVYSFTPDDQLAGCCSCPVTPNGLVALSGLRDLVAVPFLLAPSAPPDPVTLLVKLLPTVPVANTCANSAANPGPSSPGLHAWTTALVGAKEGFPTVETTEFLRTSSPLGERQNLAERCAALMANSAGLGVCRSCRLGSVSTGR